MPDPVLVAAAFGALVVTVCIALVAATWTVSRSTRHLASNRDLQMLDARITKGIEAAEHDCGEGLAAIRTKVNEVELWTRDNLAARKDVADVETALRDVNRRLEALGPISTKVDTIWDFVIARARLEAKAGGFMEIKSPLTLTPEGWKAVEPILPAVEEYVCTRSKDAREFSISDLELEIARVFRDRLLNEVCEPNGIYMGACLVMVIEALRLKKIIGNGSAVSA